jgi:transposase-like protein
VVDAERLATALQLIAAGQSVVSVARTLGVGRSSLYRAIERERAGRGGGAKSAGQQNEVSSERKSVEIAPGSQVTPARLGP